MSRPPDYREIEHTADVGIELEAPDLASAFERAAAAMFDVMCDLETVRSSARRPVRVEGRPGDTQNLLVRWLSELLYLFERDGLLLSTFAVGRAADGVIEAEVGGEPYDPARHAVRVEIKAPTYHDLLIRESGGRWTVRVIFDT